MSDSQEEASPDRSAKEDDEESLFGDEGADDLSR